MSRRRMQCTINVDRLVMWVEQVFPPLPGCVLSILPSWGSRLLLTDNYDN